MLGLHAGSHMGVLIVALTVSRGSGTRQNQAATLSSTKSMRGTHSVRNRSYNVRNGTHGAREGTRAVAKLLRVVPDPYGVNRWILSANISKLGVACKRLIFLAIR